MTHQPDQIVAKNSGGTFLPHPEGQFAAVCVDVIDFGEKVEAFPGKPERLTPKCGLVFRTGETNPENGEYIDVVKEFTVSSNEKANLRLFLEQWRGKTYSDHEVDEGLPLHKLCGVAALVTIEHIRSRNGRTYANIRAVAGLPKQMLAAAPRPDGYKRPDYLAERKKQFAEEAAKYRSKVNAPKSRPDTFEDFPADDGSGDDLPF